MTKPRQCNRCKADGTLCCCDWHMYDEGLRAAAAICKASAAAALYSAGALDGGLADAWYNRANEANSCEKQISSLIPSTSEARATND